MDRSISSSGIVGISIIVEFDYQLLVNFSPTGCGQSIRSSKSIVVLFEPRLIVATL